MNTLLTLQSSHRGLYMISLFWTSCQQWLPHYWSLQRVFSLKLCSMSSPFNSKGFLFFFPQILLTHSEGLGVNLKRILPGICLSIHERMEREAQALDCLSICMSLSWRVRDHRHLDKLSAPLRGAVVAGMGLTVVSSGFVWLPACLVQPALWGESVRKLVLPVVVSVSLLLI